MEWLPKLYDTLDSLVFELRMRWAGHVGQSISNLAFVIAALLLSAVSPVIRNLVIATIASFMFAELVSVGLGRKKPRDEPKTTF